MIKIAAPGVGTDAVIDDIYTTVSQKTDAGIYQAAGLCEDALHAPFAFRDHQAFLTFYLETLRENAFVDISDFEITEKRNRGRSLLIALKKIIWSLLRFYTYRLWSQQNQINGLLLAAVEGIHEQQREKIAALEARLKALEKT